MRRRAIQRLLLAAGAPVAFLILLELTLRLAGFGHAADFFVPADAHGVVCSNERFAWRFVPPALSRAPCPVRLAVKKPPGTTRIFVLGSSAAQGFPDPAFSVGRFLQVMLESVWTQRIEVVNTAMTAMNSHVVRVVAEECARYEPDYFVVYCGNNEVIGPFGPGTVFQPFLESLALTRLRVLLSGTRAAQAMGGLARKLRPAPALGWGGMAMFAAHQVPADDPRLETVYRHFRANLLAICRAAGGAGAKTLLCSVPVNLRDCPPFAPTNRLAGETAESLFAAGRFEEACDADGLRFRADRRIDATIRGLWTTVPGAIPVDLAARLDGDDDFHEHVHLNLRGSWRAASALFTAMTGGTPPSFAVCRDALAATAFDDLRLQEEVARLRSRPPFTMQSDHAGRQSRQQRTLEELRAALTPETLAQCRRTYEEALRLRPDDDWLLVNFAGFLDRTGDTAGAVTAWRRVVALRPQHRSSLASLALALGKGGQTAEAVALLREVARAAPELPAIRKSIGDLLLLTGDIEGAKAAYRKAIALHPAFADALANLAAIREREGPAGAEEAFTLMQRAAAVSDQPTTHAVMARMLAQRGRAAEALPHFERAVAGLPGDIQVRGNMAATLMNLGRHAEARHQLEIILQREPGNRDARKLMDAIERMPAAP